MKGDPIKSLSGTSLQSIQDQIDNVEHIVTNQVDDFSSVSAEELINYFDGEAPSGDTTLLEDIVSNEFLLIHELIEINELKKMGFIISAELLWTNPSEVDQAHITATEFELTYAYDRNDEKWITVRLKDLQSWIDDENMAEELKIRCSKLLDRYKEFIR